MRQFILLIFSLFTVLFSSCLAKDIEWQFPRDYGPHNQYNTEWWYFTGHLTGSDDQLYGFQVTFFRYKLKQVPNSVSPFNSPHMYSVHFAFTDRSKNKFYHETIHARDAFEQVRSDEKHLDLKVNSWHVRHQDNTFYLNIPSKIGVFSLELTPSKPIIFQGENGLSFKSSDKSVFSHYYSHTRLIGTGKLVSEDNNIKFKEASAWMDREIFDRLLTKTQIGWVWFAIQLDTEEELMIFRVDGKEEDFYSATFIDVHGNNHSITAEHLKIKALKTWQSPSTRQEYPIKWEIHIDKSAHPKNQDLALIIDPVLSNQELTVEYPFKLSYWEGQAIVSGTNKGRAYIEVVPLIQEN